MNIGYFTSFTVFLALNDPDFCNKYLRPVGSTDKQGILTLKEYMTFWGAAYLIITLCVWAFKHEDNFQAPGNLPINFIAITVGLPSGSHSPQLHRYVKIGPSTC